MVCSFLTICTWDKVRPAFSPFNTLVVAFRSSKVSLRDELAVMPSVLYFTVILFSATFRLVKVKLVLAGSCKSALMVLRKVPSSDPTNSLLPFTMACGVYISEDLSQLAYCCCLAEYSALLNASFQPRRFQ